jgi:hypothetical protein
MSPAIHARAEIRDAIKDRIGPVQAAADLIGVHVTNLYAFLRGSRLEPETAGKLRALLPSVADSTWADAFAPTPSEATVGHDAAHMEGANVAPPAVNDAEAA